MAVITRDVANPAEQERTCTINPFYKEGLNQGMPSLPGGIGTALKKLTEVIPIATDFTARDFMGLYHIIESTLEPYGPLLVRERKFITPVGDVGTLDACRDAEVRGDKLKCGSYLAFATEDRTLEGALHVGYKEDRELLRARGEGLAVEERVKFVVEKLRDEGFKGGLDAAAAYVLRRIWLPAALLSAGDLVRRIYNMSNFDAHWSLEMNPQDHARVTSRQYMAYRHLLEKLK